MSKTYNAELQARVEQFLTEKKISQAKAAPMMGISQTALSQYRRSMYDNGDITALESKLEEFFRTLEEQEASAKKALPYRPMQDYIPTSISEDVYKMIRYCQIEKGMVIIHGDAGIGKTKGAAKFVRENPAASVYIQATPTIGTLGNLMKVIARALRVPESRNKLDLLISFTLSSIWFIKAAPHDLARAICEGFFDGGKTQKRRNTLCISSFCGKSPAEKTRKAPPSQSCGAASKKQKARAAAFRRSVLAWLSLKNKKSASIPAK